MHVRLDSSLYFPTGLRILIPLMCTPVPSQSKTSQLLYVLGRIVLFTYKKVGGKVLYSVIQNVTTDKRGKGWCVSHKGGKWE